MDTQRLYLKVCEQCGCQFESHFAVTRYCSARCANLSKKHKLRDERLQNLGDEVRERERLALLDKNFLTITDAARLLQMSRNTLYKIIKENDIPLKRFSLRTVRIAREDLERVATLDTTSVLENKYAKYKALVSGGDLPIRWPLSPSESL